MNLLSPAYPTAALRECTVTDRARPVVTGYLARAKNAGTRRQSACNHFGDTQLRHFPETGASWGHEADSFLRLSGLRHEWLDLDLPTNPSPLGGEFQGHRLISDDTGIAQDVTRRSAVDRTIIIVI